MHRKLIFLLTIFSLSLQPYFALGQPLASKECDNSALTVRGSGEISAAPDLALVQLGAVAQSGKAVEAQNRVNQTSGAILKAITATGISAEKISTAELTLVPVYDRSQRVSADQNPARIVGYLATNLVRVEIEEMNKIGDVIDAAIGAGANRLERLSFELKDDTLFRKKALRQAALNAREKAAEIADTLNLRLVRILEISEEGVHTVRPQFRIQRMAALAAESTPVQPGQIQVSASVIIGYQIENSGSSAAPSSD